jgi:hypothetical protein
MKRDGKSLHSESAARDADAQLRRKLQRQSDADARAERVEAQERRNLAQFDFYLQLWEAENFAIATEYEVSPPAAVPNGSFPTCEFRWIFPSLTLPRPPSSYLFCRGYSQLPIYWTQFFSPRRAARDASKLCSGVFRRRSDCYYDLVSFGPNPRQSTTPFSPQSGRGLALDSSALRHLSSRQNYDKGSLQIGTLHPGNGFVQILTFDLTHQLGSSEYDQMAPVLPILRY